MYNLQKKHPGGRSTDECEVILEKYCTRAEIKTTLSLASWS